MKRAKNCKVVLRHHVMCETRRKRWEEKMSVFHGYVLPMLNVLLVHGYVTCFVSYVLYEP